MVFMNQVLLETKGLSGELQSPKKEQYRSEQKATDYFKKSLGITLKNNLNCCTNISGRQRKETSKLEEYIVLTSLGKRETIFGSSNLRRAVLYPTVDVLLHSKFSGVGPTPKLV